MSDDDWREIEEALGEGDADRYVATFFAPARLRRALYALYAFDHQVRRVSEMVREPMAGHLRIGWWQEQIGAIYDGGALMSPVSRALSQAVKAHALPRVLFDVYLDARVQDLEEAPFDDEAAFEFYADAAFGAIVKLAARVLGSDHRADEAATQAGRVLAHAAQLSDFSYLASRRHCRMPLAWLHEVNLNAEDVFAARPETPGFNIVFNRARALGKGALAKLNASRFPRAATPALSPATFARIQFGASFDPLKPAPLSARQRFARVALAQLLWRF